MWARRLALGAAGSFGGWCVGNCYAEARIKEDGSLTLFAVPSMEGLSDEVLVKGQGLFRQGNLSIRAFDDGTPNVRMDPKDVYNKDVVLLADYNLKNGGAGWISTLSLIYALPRYGARSLTVILPFFPVGTMERVDNEGEIATAMTFARMLSATPLTVNGPANFVFFDIHALQNRFYFNDNVLPHLVTAIPLLKREIAALEKKGEEVAIAFPDDGAKKRFWPMFSKDNDHLPVIVCSKTRDHEKRILKVTEGLADVRGKHIVIVDDLIQSGGTMMNCKELMMKEGAKAVSGYVTHGVFPGGSWKRFLNENNEKPWANFWITNSIPSTAGSITGEPFKILSLADRIVDHFQTLRDI